MDATDTNSNSSNENIAAGTIILLVCLIFIYCDHASSSRDSNGYHYPIFALERRRWSPIETELGRFVGAPGILVNIYVALAILFVDDLSKNAFGIICFSNCIANTIGIGSFVFWCAPCTLALVLILFEADTLLELVHSFAKHLVYRKEIGRFGTQFPEEWLSWEMTAPISRMLVDGKFAVIMGRVIISAWITTANTQFVLSSNRFVALYLPLNYSRIFSRKNAILMSVVLWTLTSLFWNTDKCSGKAEFYVAFGYDVVLVVASAILDSAGFVRVFKRWKEDKAQDANNECTEILR
ncbi:unnamed protein product [Anisakis simplex]|uniref:G protein-coupled receptor n=1 Tax=Anisakis simplex TaxID=6269 RepID=A0A0M3K3C3_ANISI|nr:unnamed protein product [Anisakis simplex]